MEEKSNLYIVAIVGVVAIVALIILVIGGNRGTVEDATGQVYPRDCYTYRCECGPYKFSDTTGDGCPTLRDGYSCTETRVKVRCSD